MFTDNWILVTYSSFILAVTYGLVKSIPAILFYSSGYSVLSNYDYYKVRKDKGLYGEYLIYKKLDKLPFYKQMIINAYIDKNDKNTTEIDIIMICTKGIFVIESKNYTGLITGNESDIKIKQKIRNSTIPRYNPVLQNRNHIKWLNYFLKNLNSKIFHSIIVFGDNSDTSQFIHTQSDYILTKTSRITQDINFEKYKDVISFSDINNIYHILLNNVFVDEKVKQRQIEHAIKTQKANKYRK